VKFEFVAKHRGVWPAVVICGALGVSRSGFYAWLNRPRSQRSLTHESIGKQVKQSFLDSDRTYGARRVWRDVLASGVDCGLHLIEKLMQQQTERIARKVYRTRDEARAEVFDYTDRFYNPTRSHSIIGCVSPVQFEQAHRA
jgi:putative transposase